VVIKMLAGKIPDLDKHEDLLYEPSISST